MAQEVKPRRVVRYRDKSGIEPFTKWLVGLRDAQTRLRILRRLDRLESGNYGDFKSLKDGVFELRLSFGAGYRVYFGEEGDTVVILLCGGDKSTQDKDIDTAKEYWKEQKNG